MVRAMDAEGFGNCTNIYECVAASSAEISGSVVARISGIRRRIVTRKRG
jgi:hypothetical protein